MSSEKPFILITNDDGIYAEGLKYLCQALKEHATLRIVAPTKERSGSGLGVTVRDPLFVNTVNWEDQKAWKVSGTPADCVRMALSVLLEKKPDLIVSGINPGANQGQVLLYSGTIGCVIEGALRGIPGVAFSCDDMVNTDFTIAEKFIWPIVQHILEHPLPAGSFLNVNFPKKQIPFQGVKFARQGRGYWIEKHDQRTHPEGYNYYWPIGQWHRHEEHEESDVALLEKGYITAVPIKIAELTDHEAYASRKAHFEGLFT